MEEDTIVVWGYRTPDSISFFNPTLGVSTGNFPGGYPYPGGSTYGYLYNYTYGPYDSYKAQIAFKADMPELTSIQKEAVEYLADIIDEFREVAKDPAFLAKNLMNDKGQVISNNEISMLIESIDVFVTNDSFDNGGVGAADVKDNPYNGDRDVQLSVNVDSLVNWMGSNNNGVFVPNHDKALNYLAHELGHVNDFGYQLNSDLNQGGMTASEWLVNESSAFAIGEAILSSAGLSTNFDPGTQYQNHDAWFWF